MKALEILRDNYISIESDTGAKMALYRQDHIQVAIAELEALENRKCENCKKWVGNAPFKGFCSVTGSSCCLGGCNDYWESKQ